MTGEDVVEISCHGSLLIANEIIECYLKKGASYATRGEFSSRAFYNGKMDLVEAEAVNDLINATTKEAKTLSLMSARRENEPTCGPPKEISGGPFGPY
jgi:Predicted GTPase